MSDLAFSPRPHPTDGKCMSCGCKLPDPLFVAFADGFPSIAVTTCDHCLAKMRVQDERRQLAYWLDNTPPEFQKPWDRTIGNNELLSRVLAYDMQSRRGLMISGESGRCKTRVCYQLLRRLTLMHVNWRMIRASAAIEAKIPDGAITAELLVLDDLGNELSGPGVDRMLLKLIQSRCDANKPTIVTSQFTGETFLQRYPSEAAMAIIRRLGEFCDYINANNTSQPKHEQRGLPL